MRPSFCLKDPLAGPPALRRPSVPRAAGKLRNHLKKSSSNKGGLTYFSSGGKMYSGKMSHLSLFCFCCGEKKQACSLYLCIYHLSLKAFFYMYLKKL